MKSFLNFLGQNLIRYGTVTIIVLMLISALLSFYNKKEMLSTTNTKNKAEEVKNRLNSIFNTNLNGIDLGLRGYAITKDEKMLDPYNGNFSNTKSNLDSIENLLLQQGLDSSITSFKKIKLAVNNYLLFVDQMKVEAKKEDITRFKEMLALDKGYDLYRFFAPFLNNHIKYENEVIVKAEKDYESAMNRNIILQLTLLVIGLPVMVMMIFRLDREDNSRKELLLELEKNNKQYLFNDGTEVDTKSTKQVIENSIQNFIKANQFITNISEGNYDTKWEGLNNQNLILNEDSLAGRLLKMRDEMKHVKLEDEKRNWINEGLTKFSEIVRNNQNDLQKLSDKCIQFLTKYLNAQQGSLFVVKGDRNAERSLELTGCYAYDKKKYIEKSIQIGEGMIGQVYLEEKAIVLKQIPNGYTEITSGLGEATPDCLMIVPLKYNEMVEAIVELAGFGNFEDYKINFIEKAGEFLAAALLNVETTQQMKEYLEQSQEQRQIMSAQEEEMRQNMEELVTTQEEIFRKNREMEQAFIEMQRQTEENLEKERKLRESELWLQTIIDNLPKAVFWKEKTNLSYLGANKIFSNIAGFNSKTIIGKTDFDCPWKRQESEMFRLDDREVLETKVSKVDIEEKQTDANGDTKWMSTTKVPILDYEGESVAVLCMFEDITKRKLQEEDYFKKLSEIDILKEEIKTLKEELDLHK